ncbi:MAG: caspase family protein [Deltaproteobacteria bacterium]|nr:MAG: caspase family protein [Deltaproteobacteria bacterium]
MRVNVATQGRVHRLLLVLGLSLLWTSVSFAQDVRVAFLVGNQRGWPKDPVLNYAVSGDLKPMSRALKGLGFELHTVLANQSAERIRQAFRSMLARLKRKPKVTTFFFYYSGHADKEFFHTGPNQKKPLSFQEFVKFLDQIQVKRRFAVVDACFSGEIIRRFGSLGRYRHLRSRGDVQSKGIRRQLVETDLRKHLPNLGNQTHGLQIISSSQDLSFESARYKSSVFTHHFLNGLQGRADLDRDGKISLNELFLYTKPRVKRETGQSPQQWLFREGSEAYTFAPAYKSMLWIGPQIQGHLQVAVGNFVWRQKKSKRKAIKLAVMPGQGWVRLQRGKKCWRQRVHFPLSQRVVLRSAAWEVEPCGARVLLSKGAVELEARPPAPLHQERAWLFEAQGGVWGSNGYLQTGGDILAGGLLGFRSPHVGLLLGVWGTSLVFGDQSYQQLVVEARLEGGYRHRWRDLDWFGGAYVTLGALLQDLNQEPNPALFLHAGLTTTLGYWVTERVSLLLAADLGVLPQFAPDQVRFHVLGSVRLGLRIFWGSVL